MRLMTMELARRLRLRSPQFQRLAALVSSGPHGPAAQGAHGTGDQIVCSRAARLKSGAPTTTTASTSTTTPTTSSGTSASGPTTAAPIDFSHTTVGQKLTRTPPCGQAA